ncbi:NAD(P)H:quinone oxidoreductase [Pseudovibrio sp. SPO723]|uniref:NAD(P)H:quinone oxidoreductase n=1 Tax=Nesiotobacter zosterae TaxID=392721 RepID=UPI0029C3B5E4|nr:NAD(P)H:quinone oxidoreductase [Pseudovibrio sp. SPO723]MDX5594221.1 NAD(P)H:quinone oxidoreductase [Pseudovibrio sp. SPO723]
MTKVLVLFYSSYGHIHTMAQAVAEGARQVPGVTVDVKQVPETVPQEVRHNAGYQDFEVPVATVAELETYDAIIFGTPSRFGNMAAQMKQFIDQCGGLWARNAMVGKVGGIFTSTGSQHGGQESVILSFQIALQHLGMLIAGMPYTFQEQTRIDHIIGGSPYGAGTVAGGASELQPTETDLAGARFQGAHIAQIAARLVATPSVTEQPELV